MLEHGNLDDPRLHDAYAMPPPPPSRPPMLEQWASKLVLLRVVGRGLSNGDRGDGVESEFPVGEANASGDTGHDIGAGAVPKVAATVDDIGGRPVELVVIGRAVAGCAKHNQLEDEGEYFAR